MRVLWFEITTPSAYTSSGQVLGGWQDSLENLVKEEKDIELIVSFISNNPAPARVINGVQYEPIYIKYNYFEKLQKRFTWDVEERTYVNAALNVVKKVNPDIIQVFGCEFPFGLIAEKVAIPIVIHIQGAIIPYHNASYPPNYNVGIFFRRLWPNFVAQIYAYVKEHKEVTRVKMEERIWKRVNYYMGRTKWDESLVKLFNTSAQYFHVEEALRQPFWKTKKKWVPNSSSKKKLLSIGIGTFWKGPDMLLKTANILKSSGLNFEWLVAGEIRNDVKKIVEKHEGLKFEECNVKILGFKNSEDIIELLTTCSIYVHTAYIDNSPNSICEAQLLGTPVISTFVGGIDSLITNNEDGVLVPANDPWRMAQSIIDISYDYNLQIEMSRKSMEKARLRHNNQLIINQLINCYYSIVKNV